MENNMAEKQPDNFHEDFPIPSSAFTEITDGLARLQGQMELVIDAISQIRDHDVRLTKVEARLDSMDFNKFRDENREVKALLQGVRADFKSSIQSHQDKFQIMEKDLATSKMETGELRNQITKLERWRSIVLGGAIVIMFFLSRFIGSYVDNLINPQQINIQAPTPQVLKTPAPVTIQK